MTKFLVVGCLIGGLIIFGWGAISHTVLMLPGSLDEFMDKQAVLDAVRAQTPGNGMYLDTRGVLVALSLRPDAADRTQEMGGRLVLEYVTNVLEALLLCLLLLRSRAAGAFDSARFTGIAGIAAWLGLQVSYWNWYGFATPFVVQSLMDIAIGWFLAGLLLGRLRNKWVAAV